MGENQFRRRMHRARLVAMHALDLLRPFPPLVGEVEAEPAHMLMFAAGECAVVRWLFAVVSIAHIEMDYAESSAPSAIRLIAKRRRSHCCPITANWVPSALSLAPSAR